MKFVVLGGAGMVGSTVAKDLAGLKDVQEVCIADINLDNARKKAAEIGSIATAKAADINNPKALADLFRDYKVVVNCVGPFFLLVQAPVSQICAAFWALKEWTPSMRFTQYLCKPLIPWKGKERFPQYGMGFTWHMVRCRSS